MKFLFIAWGYLPYTFSEGLCNGKFVYALTKAGHQVKAISRIDTGHTYDAKWNEPWDKLKDNTFLIDYPIGNKLQRAFDVLRSSMIMDGNHDNGIRWARRAYQYALKLIKTEHFDAVLTRSPNDIAHLVGYKLKQKTDIKWIANWNDPASPIWPGQYKHPYSEKRQAKKMLETEKLLKSADVNTFPSASLYNHFEEYFPFLKNRPSYIIPHIGLYEELWPKPATPFSDGKLRFLHSGNLSFERDPETTFQAFRRLIDKDNFRNFEFHIMGNVNEHTTDLIKKYELEDFVKFIGTYPYMETLSKMQTYDILVLIEAKLKKGIFFASKFTDYLQSGQPILAISPKSGFAADILAGENRHYLANNESVDSIYKSLCEIINNFKSNSLKENCSDIIFNKFSTDTVIKSFMNFNL